MKISVIGAGNVGSLSAMRIAQDGLGEVLLVDVVKGLAQGKAYDMEDARQILKNNYDICGTDDIREINNSDIVIVTAGLARKPGMSREELLSKNAAILKDISLSIKKLAPESILIVVTNPLDLMTYFALKITGFKPRKVFGMGISLDASRFSNIIGKKLNIPSAEIDACVIGSHGEGMLPLAKFTKVKGASLDKLLEAKEVDALLERTVKRGAEIVGLLGSGSAFFAPSAAINELVRGIAKDEKRTFGVSAYLNGEYGVREICIGVPVVLGRYGIENIIELELSEPEKEKFRDSAENLKKLAAQLPGN